MHQMSFAGFASAQKPALPFLPVFVVDPLRLNYGAHVVILRREFEWDCVTSGSCLDATDRVPLGFHRGIDCVEQFVVNANSYSRGGL